MNNRRLPKPRSKKAQKELSTEAIVYRQRIENAGRRFEASEKLKAQRFEIAYERGRRECLAFCAKFHAALPRELRDLVYDQLIMPGKRHHVYEARDELGQPRVSNNPLVSVSFFDPRSRIPEQPSVRQDIWRYREYTGSIVAKEIAERWYHTGLFILDAEDFLLPTFLSTDVWEHDAMPSEAIRHLRINIDSQTFSKLETVHGIMASLEHLSTIANKNTEILFHLSWRYGLRGLRPVVAMLNVIGPTIQRLRAEGYKKVKIHQSSCDDCQKDITRIHDDLVEAYEELFQGEIPGDDEKARILGDILYHKY